ncbi:MAG: hypothetical protein RLO12_06975 [Fulvivirga sp.]|uniref:hypothetical protein n=1 Tax=Fulvivirga sp. TaxID=1931237 RepID=UPI0032FFA76F
MEDNIKTGKLLSLNLKKEEAQSKITNATKLLYLVAGINLLFGVFNYLSSGIIIILILSAILSLIVFGLGLWSRKSPFTAILIAFIFLGGLFTIDFMNYQQLSLLGIAFRIAVLLTLIFGLYNVMLAKKIIKEYNELAGTE